MGILSKVVFFPVSGPIAGIKWSLGQVQKVVEEELTDDEPVKRDLMELQMQLELGDIDDDEYVRREAELMTRLREVRAWRERLGKSTSASAALTPLRRPLPVAMVRRRERGHPARSCPASRATRGSRAVAS